MATFTAARALPTFPVAKTVGGGLLSSAFGVIAVAANPVAADIYQICRVPAGAIVTGGYFWGQDLDTNATETLDLDVGWADNGVEVADPDGFGNFGPLLTDTVAGIKPEGGTYLPLGGVLWVTGPQAFSAETIIQVTCVATAATFAAGSMGLVVHYLNP